MKAVKQMVATNTSTNCRYAQSESGKWFQRFRQFNGFGYAWTKWQECGEPSSARQCSEYEVKAVRLPA